MPAGSTPASRVCAALLGVVAKRGGDVAASGDSVQYDAARAPALALEDYICRWAKYAEAGDAEMLIAMVYIDRVCTKTGLRLTARNVHRVLLGALLVATKWREEHPFKMSYYAKIGGVTLQELERLEVRFINDLCWQMHVEPAVLRKYTEKFRAHPAWAAEAQPAVVEGRREAVVRADQPLRG
eukprot:TRINITY_DN942_c0_g1_i1.p2 TRINITY_DN942_c0_g1~~TRINITY_DN942_c0_g1_i1.p2  ORF type:complete len:183 (+),score=79.17 TRINITY_DN942_c0_g1_i1:83-631(+)